MTKPGQQQQTPTPAINQQEISNRATAYCDGKTYTSGPIRKVAYMAFVAGSQHHAALRSALEMARGVLEGLLGCVDEPADPTSAVALERETRRVEAARSALAAIDEALKGEKS